MKTSSNQPPLKRPLVAIIGRPNVGKSSLFNRLMRKQYLALVEDIPGVTRDLHYANWDLSLDGESVIPLELIDTGGFLPELVEPMGDSQLKKREDVAFQEGPIFYKLLAEMGQEVVNTADYLIWVLDGKEGAKGNGQISHPYDDEILKLILTSKKPFVVVINKIDHANNEDSAWNILPKQLAKSDRYKIILASTAHGTGISELEEHFSEIFSNLKQNTHLSEPITDSNQDHRPMKLGIMGTPNAGKSTLLNALLGSKRALVSPFAGTTLDPVAARWQVNPQLQVELVDTAGIRKKSKINSKLESLAVMKAFQVVKESDIIIVLVDGLMGLSHHYRRLIDIALEQGKSIVIAISKMDLAIFPKESRYHQINKSLETFRGNLPWNFIPVVGISAKTGEGLNELSTWVSKIAYLRSKKLSTSKLNDTLHQLMNSHLHYPKGQTRRGQGKPLKLKYATQVASNPPTVILYCNMSERIDHSYRRYLAHGIRQRFQLAGTPVHLVFRKTDSDNKIATKK